MDCTRQSITSEANRNNASALTRCGPTRKSGRSRPMEVSLSTCRRSQTRGSFLHIAALTALTASLTPRLDYSSIVHIVLYGVHSAVYLRFVFLPHTILRSTCCGIPANCLHYLFSVPSRCSPPSSPQASPARSSHRKRQASHSPDPGGHSHVHRSNSKGSAAAGGGGGGGCGGSGRGFGRVEASVGRFGDSDALLREPMSVPHTKAHSAAASHVLPVDQCSC